jgi:hypothetical protein
MKRKSRTTRHERTRDEPFSANRACRSCRRQSAVATRHVSRGRGESRDGTSKQTASERHAKTDGQNGKHMRTNRTEVAVRVNARCYCPYTIEVGHASTSKISPRKNKNLGNSHTRIAFFFTIMGLHARQNIQSERAAGRATSRQSVRMRCGFERIAGRVYAR